MTGTRVEFGTGFQGLIRKKIGDLPAGTKRQA